MQPNGTSLYQLRCRTRLLYGRNGIGLALSCIRCSCMIVFCLCYLRYTLMFQVFLLARRWLISTMDFHDRQSFWRLLIDQSTNFVGRVMDVYEWCRVRWEWRARARDNCIRRWRLRSASSYLIDRVAAWYAHIAPLLLHSRSFPTDWRLHSTIRNS